MSVSSDMKNALASNVTFLATLWRMEARDGAVAAYTSHSRPLTFDGTTYQPAPVEPSRSSRKMGLESDNFDLTGPFDSQVTLAHLAAHKWERARVTKYLVDYTDLGLGYAQCEKGFVGNVSRQGQLFTVECLSLGSALDQEVGAVTGPADRNRTVLELTGDEGPVTHNTRIDTVTDRRIFTTEYTPSGAEKPQYGRVVFIGGANAGLEMEIKSNDGAEITLQLPMPFDIENGDDLNVVEGYDGSRNESVRLAGSALNMQSEPDLPGIAKVALRYPES